MITKEEVVIGTKEELADYFYKLSGSAEEYITESKSNLLITKEGLTKQIEEFQLKSTIVNSVGLIFFLTKSTIISESGKPEINLTLISKFFKVKN